MDITIGRDAPRIRYNPMIFGGFLEHFEKQIYGGIYDPGSPLADGRGYRQDVLGAIRELNVPVIRWPGGCYASGYHWMDGVGKRRTPTDDMAWGVVEPHDFGTDEFLDYCAAAGCEPYICNNAGNGTIREMVSWVEYCNATSGALADLRRENGYEEPRRVQFWSIGNENWGQHEIGAKPIDEWAPFVRDAAQAMKGVDPTITVSAAALPQREWIMPLLEVAGEYLDLISVHGYWLPLWQEHTQPDYMSCIVHSEEPEARITDTAQVIEEAGFGSKIKIAFDEWNLRGWHHPGFPRKEIQDYQDPEVKALIAAREKNAIQSQYTIADALFSASFLNACLRNANHVSMANIAPLVNTRGPIYVSSEGVVKRAHYHTLWMYSNLLQEYVVEATVNTPTFRHDGTTINTGEAIATTDDAGRVWSIAVANRHPSEPLAVSVELNGSQITGSREATVLGAETINAYNDTDCPNAISPAVTNVEFVEGSAVLPAHSLTIIILS